jgi:diguanylate cyclase (GGDEF)-like protein
LPEVSFLVAVSDPSDPGLWEAVRAAGVHGVVSAATSQEEITYRLNAAANLRRLDDMAKLSATKLEGVRKTLQGFRHVDMDTGLSNRRALLERLTDMLYLTQRYKRPLSLVVFHVRNHEALTDSLDPDDLSQCYEELADQLQLAQRASDLAARVSPDSFAIMLPETPLDGAQIVADRMSETLAQSNSVGVTIDISTGVATSTDGEMEASNMVDAAVSLARGA